MTLPRLIATTLYLCVALNAATAHADSVHTSMPLDLETEQRSDFFTFFHLIEVGTPASAGASQTWHRFRPSGPAFHDLVELDILTAPDGTIGAMSLGVDRSFIESRANGVFARDIVKSFLGVTDRTPSPPLSGLIANIADLSAGGRTVLMRGPVPPPSPPDTTGGYRVYLGEDQRAAFTDAGRSFTFTNFTGALPRDGAFQTVAGRDGAVPGQGGWLRIDVHFGSPG